MKRRRKDYTEPARCVCEPGPASHPVHGRPGSKAAAHDNPKCPHSTLRDTTRPMPQPKAKKPKRSKRVDLNEY